MILGLTKKEAEVDAGGVGVTAMGSSPFLISAFTAIAILGSLHSLSMIGVEVYRIINRTKMINSLETELSGLREEEAGLRAIIENRDDDLYREQLARCIGYAYPNEDRYITINNSLNTTLPNCQ